MLMPVDWQQISLQSILKSTIYSAFFKLETQLLAQPQFSENEQQEMNNIW